MLGFQRYLFWFSIYKIRTLRRDKGEKDFFAFTAMLNDKDTVLDIGANIGIMTTHLAKKVKNGKVLCFEPMPDNVIALRMIMEHFNLSNVELFDIALGNEDDEIEMVMPVVNKVRKQGLSHVVHKDIADFNEGDRIRVTSRRLDSLLNDYPNPIQAIKIDVENFEYFVLDGAIELLKKHKPVVYCELWANENRNKCFALMRDIGYSIKVLDNRNLVDFNPEMHSTQNFFFV